MSVYSTQAFAERARGKGAYRHYGSTEQNFHALQASRKHPEISRVIDSDYTEIDDAGNCVKKEETKMAKTRREASEYREAVYAAYAASQEKFTETLKNEGAIFTKLPRKGNSAYHIEQINYCDDLQNNAIDSKYFSKDDGEIYSKVEAFYNADYDTNDGKDAILELVAWYNILRRQIEGKPMDIAERMSMKQVATCFKNGTSFKTGFMGRSHRNIVKEVAWGVTHSVVTDLIMTENQIISLIPKKGDRTIDLWNKFIQAQDDIPHAIRDAFIVHPNGICDFRNGFRYHDVEIIGPGEDIPFDPASVVKVIDLDDSAIIEESQAMDEDYKNAVARDNSEASAPVKQEVIQEMIPVAPAIGPAVQQQIIQPQPPQMAEIMRDIIPVNPLINIPAVAPENRSETYKTNNNDYHGKIPRLGRFTEIVNGEGLNVLYSQDNSYPGLVTAQIEDNNGHIIKTFGIDDCIMYGDTLRVITNDSVKHDIRMESYIPISMAESIKRAIHGTLTQEERMSLLDRLPKQMVDRRYKYGFLDRVDMSGLTYENKGTIIKGLPYEKWLTLINNIATAVFDANIPIARFRIEKYNNPGDFSLIADEFVRYTFPTEIIHLGTNIDAVTNHTKIIYKADDTDPSKSPITTENVVTYNKRHRRTKAEMAESVVPDFVNLTV